MALGAAQATVEVVLGLDGLYCPKCGCLIFDERTSWDESECPHVRFVEDWAGELWVAPFERVPDAQRAPLRWLEACESVQLGELLVELAGSLPASYLVLTVAEPRRGGGALGAAVTVGLDLAPQIV